MNALAETFDSLGYFERLKEAGVPEPQARVQAEALRQQTEAQRAALRQELDRYDEASRRELATKGDVQDVRGELQNVRNELKEEIQDVRNELKDTKHEILKWMIATMIAQTALIVAVIAFLK